MNEEEEAVLQELYVICQAWVLNKEHKGFPHNVHNPRFNLNTIQSETLTALIMSLLEILNEMIIFKEEGWELTQPVKSGKVRLHYEGE